MGREDDLDGAVCALDLAHSGLRQELHQPKLALGMQVSFRLLDQQQWQAFGFPPEKQ